MARVGLLAGAFLGHLEEAEPSTVQGSEHMYVNEVITNGAADAIEIFNP